MRTSEPISLDDLKLRPGKTRAIIQAEVLSGRAQGTRRAVKIAVQIGKKTIVGWASRSHFKLDTLNKARRDMRKVKDGLHTTNAG